MAKYRFLIDGFMEIFSETSRFDTETYPWWMARRMVTYILIEYGFKFEEREDESESMICECDHMVVDCAVNTIMSIFDITEYDARSGFESVVRETKWYELHINGSAYGKYDTRREAVWNARQTLDAHPNYVAVIFVSEGKTKLGRIEVLNDGTLKDEEDI